MKGVGVLSREDAISFGATGGTGRASGWACDVRKRHPYAMYGKVDFKEIVHTEGDCFARYMVRMEEILESMDIIEQLIDNIPEGNYQEKMKPIIRVPKGIIMPQWKVLAESSVFIWKAWRQISLPHEIPRYRFAFSISNGNYVPQRKNCRLNCYWWNGGLCSTGY